MLQKPPLTSSLLKYVAPPRWLRNLLWGRGLIMLLHYGLVQVHRVKAYMQGSIRLKGVGEQRYPFGRPEDRHNDSLLDHFIKGMLYLFLVLNGYFPLDMLNWGKAWVCPDGISPRHVVNCIEGSWEGPLQGSDVLHCGGRARRKLPELTSPWVLSWQGLWVCGD